MPVSTSSDAPEFAIAHAAFSFTRIRPPVPAQRLLQWPPAQSKFLAVVLHDEVMGLIAFRTIAKAAGIHAGHAIPVK